MTRSNQFDHLNRLTNLVWNVGGSNVASFAYQYNDANQRTRATLADGSYWLYQYDALGQVTSAKRYWSDDTPVAGQQTTFTFDDIGNRKVTTSGGDQTGANLRSANYAANTLNQITSRDVPGYVNILGTATNTATVSLWSKESTALYTPTYRKGDYFRGEMPLNNSTGAVWLTITNVAVLSNYVGADVVTNTVGKLFVPKTAEMFGYDLDGNLTNDGRWSYTWDAENRVTSFTRNSSAPSGSKIKLDCQYDHRSRRTQKIVSTWNGLAYVAQSTNRFVYDGWNLIAILDATNGLVQSFTWGTDASGTMQGAGGVGGLISMTVHQGTNAGTYFYCYDGNHNVATLVNATNGAVEAVYEYDPFLGITRATGRLAFVNPFVGSTKFCDWETGFLYYGYRYYDPDTGRWPNRDPIEEQGGVNLYGFVQNDAINFFDALGLEIQEIVFWTYIEWPTVTDPFGNVFRGDNHGSGGAGSFRTIHRIVIETCGPKKGLIPGSEWKDTGITELLDPKTGAVLKTGKATGKTLKATVTTGPDTVTVKMEGDETNPLHNHMGVKAPAISYHLTIIFNTKTGRATFSGTHDGFPSYQAYSGGKLIRDWSHVQAGTDPIALFPPEEISFSGGFKIEKCCP